MIDITTITELVEPASRIEIATPKAGNNSTQALWVVFLIIITIFGIWGYIVYREKESMKKNNGF
jgi:hypothetical protein